MNLTENEQDGDKRYPKVCSVCGGQFMTTRKENPFTCGGCLAQSGALTDAPKADKPEGNEQKFIIKVKLRETDAKGNPSREESVSYDQMGWKTGEESKELTRWEVARYIMDELSDSNLRLKLIPDRIVIEKVKGV